jgi:RNA polymerase sigma-70 factor (ECF subfamily)
MTEDSHVLAALDATGVDANLIERLASGDRDAVAGLYDRHASRVFSLAHRILRNGSDAEDVVQEVFSQAWRTARSYQSSRGSVAAWLLMMARTRAIDRLRTRRPGTISTDEGNVEQLPAQVTPAADHLIAREQEGHVRSALSLLPPDQRRALEMAYFDGMSQSEIASALSTPLGTIKTRIRAALATLRGRLRP